MADTFLGNVEHQSKIVSLKIENFIWVIYIGIIILSWYANSKEKNIYCITIKKVRKNIKT